MRHDIDYVPEAKGKNQMSLGKAVFLTTSHFSLVFLSMEMEETGLVSDSNCLLKHKQVLRAAAHPGSGLCHFSSRLSKTKFQNEGRVGAMGPRRFSLRPTLFGWLPHIAML